MTSSLRPGAIDIHAHWLPEELFGLPPGSPVPPMHGRDGQIFLGELPLFIETEAMTDPARVVADTDAAGLGVRVLSAPPFAFPIADDAGVDDYVGRFNEALIGACHDSGGRLLGLGLVSLHDVDAARKQLDELSSTDVVRGIAVPPLLGSGSFDVAPMRELLALASERDLAVLVHPMQLPRPEWTSYYLVNLIGNPTETTTAAASLVLGGILEELPELRICMLHGGGCAPALVGRWEHGWKQRADVRTADTRSPREGFKALWFDTLTHDGPTLELLKAHADPTHLMCGSDYPFDMGLAQPLDLPHGAGIDDDTLERNARSFLGL